MGAELRGARRGYITHLVAVGAAAHERCRANLAAVLGLAAEALERGRATEAVLRHVDAVVAAAAAVAEHHFSGIKRRGILRGGAQEMSAQTAGVGGGAVQEGCLPRRRKRALRVMWRGRTVLRRCLAQCRLVSAGRGVPAA